VQAHVHAHNALGLDHFLKGEYNLAIQECSQAIALNSQYAPAYDTRGAAYNKQDLYDAAIADTEQAITLFTPAERTSATVNLVAMYINRGFSRAQRGEYDAANTDLTKAHMLNVKTGQPAQNTAYIAKAKLMLQQRQASGITHSTAEDTARDQSPLSLATSSA